MPPVPQAESASPTRNSDSESPPDSPPTNAALALTGGEWAPADTGRDTERAWESTGDSVTVRESALLASYSASLQSRHSMTDMLESLRSQVITRTRARARAHTHTRTRRASRHSVSTL